MDVLLSSDQIQARVVELGQQIARDYHDHPVTIVGVLTGCLIFLADLVRQMDLALRMHLVQASSYRGATTTPGELHLRLDTLPDLTGRDVLVVDDILDTGQTLTKLVAALHQLGARSVRVAVLLRKEGRLQVPVAADYCGFDIPDAFVVGYGLDYNDEYRHLPHIAILTPEDIAARAG